MVAIGRLSNEDIRRMCSEHLDSIKREQLTKEDKLVGLIEREMNIRLVPKIIERWEGGSKLPRLVPVYSGPDMDGYGKHVDQEGV